MDELALVSLDGAAATHAVEVAPRIWWVGDAMADDPFQCHAYLIENGRDSVLIDPGSTLTVEPTLAKIREVMPLEHIRWIVLHHSDPDCADALHRLSDVLTRDDVHIVTEWRSALLLRHFKARFPVTSVEDLGWELALDDGRALRFLLTPYLHFPGAFVSFETSTRSLFSADLFGGFNHGRRLWAVGENDFEDLRLFHEHYMPSTEILMAGIASIRGTFPDIDALLPQHGYLIPRPLIDSMFNQLAKLECGVMRMSRSDAHLARLLEIAAVVRRVEAVLESPLPFVEVLDGVQRELCSLVPVDELWAEADLGDGTVVRLDRQTGVAGGVVDAFTESNAQRMVLGLADERSPRRMQVVVAAPTTIELTGETLGFVSMVAAPGRKVIDAALDQRQAAITAAGLRDETVHDPLTGLFNRRSLDDGPVTHDTVVMMVDIDHFKRFNDTYGHAVGDVVLQRVAGAIAASVRPVDRAVRHGGEEFLVLMESDAVPWEVPVVAAACTRLREHVATIDLADVGVPSPVTVSLGAALAVKGERLRSAIERADAALYAAKESGRDRFVLAGELVA